MPGLLGPRISTLRTIDGMLDVVAIRGGAWLTKLPIAARSALHSLLRSDGQQPFAQAARRADRGSDSAGRTDRGRRRPAVPDRRRVQRERSTAIPGSARLDGWRFGYRVGSGVRRLSRWLVIRREELIEDDAHRGRDGNADRRQDARDAGHETEKIVTTGCRWTARPITKGTTTCPRPASGRCRRPRR